MHHGGIQKQQADDLAGKTKLTAISVYCYGKTQTFFVNVEHDERGKAVITQEVFRTLLNKANVRRGDTYSIA